MINQLMGETGGWLSGLEGSECTDPSQRPLSHPPTGSFLRDRTEHSAREEQHSRALSAAASWLSAARRAIGITREQYRVPLGTGDRHRLCQGQEGLGRDGMCETDTRGKVVQAEGKAEQRPRGWMPPSDPAGALRSQSLPHTQSLT